MKKKYPNKPEDMVCVCDSCKYIPGKIILKQKDFPKNCKVCTVYKMIKEQK